MEEEEEEEEEAEEEEEKEEPWSGDPGLVLPWCCANIWPEPLNTTKIISGSTTKIRRSTTKTA